ncbi:MAG: CaiB/BaiF CoA-transferase family protein [Thermodesulfobacteriota bacterium]
MAPILSDCCVLDLSRLLPGPYCSMILADFGARVISIESRRFEKDSIYQYRSINRNKEHMTLNLKTDEGKKIFFLLAERADVILEGFRPGVAKRLGVEYESIQSINPSIIYCSITGYGQSGPLKNQAGHDLNYLGYSGALSIIGLKDGPPVTPGIQMADISGALNAAIGILLALYQREKTTKGQYIDISMTDCLIAMMPQAAGELWKTGTSPARGDSLLSHRYACYNIYQTKDRQFITLASLEFRFWEALCRFFNVPDFIPLQYDEPRREELIDYFKNIFIKKRRDEWEAIFSGQDVCLGSVWSVDEALGSELARNRKMVVQHGEIDPEGESFLGSPIKFSENPSSIRSLPPKFGEQTHSILKELGFSPDAIISLEKKGVI